MGRYEDFLKKDRQKKEEAKEAMWYGEGGFESMGSFLEKERDYNIQKKYQASLHKKSKKPKKRGPNPYYKNEPRYSMFGRGLF